VYMLSGLQSGRTSMCSLNGGENFLFSNMSISLSRFTPYSVHTGLVFMRENSCRTLK